jgi:hypothetical protein
MNSHAVRKRPIVGEREGEHGEREGRAEKKMRREMMMMMMMMTSDR